MHEGKTLRSVVTFPHKGDAEVAAHRAQHHQKAAIVFLHGLDGKPSDWQESVEWLAGKLGPNTQAVCPAAPVAAITKNQGEKMTAWCDVYEPWPLTLSSRDDIDGLSQVLTDFSVRSKSLRMFRSTLEASCFPYDTVVHVCAVCAGRPHRLGPADPGWCSRPPHRRCRLFARRYEPQCRPS
jgi:hypothetical protein